MTEDDWATIAAAELTNQMRRRRRGTGRSYRFSLAALSPAPTARWHPAFSTVTESGGRVVSASDIQGLAGLTEGGSGIGPRVLTDLNGRKFWRFEGTEFLNVAGTLTGISNRAMAVFMVGRVHRASPVPTNNMFGLGNVAQVTTVNTGNAQMTAAVTTNSAPYLRCHSIAGSADATNGKWLCTGSQMQVLSCNSRVTGSGGTRLMINERASSGLAQATTLQAACTGAEIGRYPFSPGTSGNWGCFDLYEMVFYSGTLTDGEQDAINAALVANYSISAVVNQIILEGDSITQGTTAVTSGISSGMLLAEPGAGRIPAGWRVINMGTSGNQVSNLTTKRDATNGWPSTLLPSQNVLAFEIGRNDFVSGGLTDVQHYNNVVAYLNTTTTGVLQRGFTVRLIANIATSGATQTTMVSWKAMARLPQFLTDTATQSGGAFDGKLSIVSADLIQVSGATIFEDSTDAGSATYYQGDSTHPTAIGALYRVTGADTPQYGIAYGLV